MTTTAPETIVDTQTGQRQPDVSHYAKREEITRAAIEGGIVTALCGVKFQPVRDPKRFPVCGECKSLVGMAEEMAR